LPPGGRATNDGGKKPASERSVKQHEEIVVPLQLRVYEESMRRIFSSRESGRPPHLAMVMEADYFEIPLALFVYPDS
jgi:hypothetical protein